MALEIQEIGIRLRVDAGANSPNTEDRRKPAAADDPCGCGDCDRGNCDRGDCDREGIVEECVRRVLWALDALGRR